MVNTIKLCSEVEQRKDSNLLPGCINKDVRENFHQSSLGEGGEACMQTAAVGGGDC